MKQLQTRQQKVKFLQDLQHGRITVQAILKPVAGVIYVREGNVFAHETEASYSPIEPAIPLCDYSLPYTHQVEIINFSNL
jgi:hypothetical protein